jgi:hypothetical protein
MERQSAAIEFSSINRSDVMDKPTTTLIIDDVPIARLLRALARDGFSVKADINGHLHVVDTNMYVVNKPITACDLLPNQIAAIGKNDVSFSEDKTRCRKCGGAKFSVMVPPAKHNGNGAIKLRPAHQCISCGDLLPDSSNFVLPSNGTTDESSFGTADVDSER